MPKVSLWHIYDPVVGCRRAVAHYARVIVYARGVGSTDNAIDMADGIDHIAEPVSENLTEPQRGCGVGESYSVHSV